MKKLTWTSLFVSAAMLFTVGTGFASAEGSGTGHVDPEYTITIPYDYPVRPGTPEWAEFTDHQQMVDACEIPEDILHSMTTEALVDTVLDYPLFMDMYVYDLFQTGFDQMSSSFNGIQELLSRETASSVLLNRYASVEIQPKTRSGDTNRLYVSNIETLLAQNNFSNKLDENEANMLYEETQKNMKRNHGQYIINYLTSSKTAVTIG